jgi:DNA repair protein RecO (recombination protein O)
MVHKTGGIVLRVTKYGETSAIISIFTELFGLQSYLVNGIRTAAKKNSGRAALFQPAAILELVAYHNEIRNLQRLKEFSWGHLYKNIFFDVIKHAVGLFMIELLQKCLKQPEANPDLYHFTEDAFRYLDEADEAVTANLPLYFALHVAGFFGLRIDDNYSAGRTWLDLQEGFFVAEKPGHSYFLEEPLSGHTAQLLRVMRPEELTEIKLNREKRRLLLQAYESFFSLHVPGFSAMKTLPVLRTLLDE